MKDKTNGMTLVYVWIRNYLLDDNLAAIVLDGDI